MCISNDVFIRLRHVELNPLNNVNIGPLITIDSLSADSLPQTECVVMSIDIFLYYGLLYAFLQFVYRFSLQISLNLYPEADHLAILTLLIKSFRV